MDDLTIPNPPPGMLRRGSPVWATGSREGHQWRMPATVHRVTGRLAEVAGSHSWVSGHHFAVGGLALDLTDATGRAHAAWWLMGLLDNRHWPDVATGARLWLGGTSERMRTRAWQRMRRAARFVDMTAHLDPNDTRTLPDRSRWVDAEALRLVCLHLMENDGK